MIFKQNSKKDISVFLSILLIFDIVFNLLPLSVFAADGLEDAAYYFMIDEEDRITSGEYDNLTFTDYPGGTDSTRDLSIKSGVNLKANSTIVSGPHKLDLYGKLNTNTMEVSQSASFSAENGSELSVDNVTVESYFSILAAKVNINKIVNSGNLYISNFADFGDGGVEIVSNHAHLQILTPNLEVPHESSNMHAKITLNGGTQVEIDPVNGNVDEIYFTDELEYSESLYFNKNVYIENNTDVIIPVLYYDENMESPEDEAVSVDIHPGSKGKMTVMGEDDCNRTLDFGKHIYGQGSVEKSMNFSNDSIAPYTVTLDLMDLSDMISNVYAVYSDGSTEEVSEGNLVFQVVQGSDVEVIFEFNDEYGEEGDLTEIIPINYDYSFANVSSEITITADASEYIDTPETPYTLTGTLGTKDEGEYDYYISDVTLTPHEGFVFVFDDDESEGRTSYTFTESTEEFIIYLKDSEDFWTDEIEVPAIDIFKAPANPYTISGTKGEGEGDYYISDVTLTAKEGYSISKNADGTEAGSSVSFSSSADDAVVYIIDDESGHISASVSVEPFTIFSAPEEPYTLEGKKRFYGEEEGNYYFISEVKLIPAEGYLVSENSDGSNAKESITFIEHPEE
nr:hypothetical protein [Lachnospiraceae bacterium]